MRVIVVGGGKVGTHLAELLLAGGHRVTLRATGGPAACTSKLEVP